MTNDTTTLRDARAAYYDVNGFGADGGDSLRWVPVTVLGVRFHIPNTDGRRRAVRVHDLHHVLTGYQTDFTGESEIGAWELATGCAHVPAALVLNLGALAIGLPLAPRRVLAAWARGRRTQNLYSVPYDDALLSRPTERVRRELGLEDPAAPARLGDVVGLAATWLAGVAMLAAPLVALAAAAVRVVR